MRFRIYITVLAALLFVPCWLCHASDILSNNVGFLLLQSEPVEVSVVIDGIDTVAMHTPVLCTLSVGKHTVTVTREYYDPKTIMVEIEPLEVLRRTVSFVEPTDISSQPAEGFAIYRRKGSLTILTDGGGATVHIDTSKIKEPTPVTLSEIAEGPHRLYLEQNGLALDTVIRIIADSTLVFHPSLADFTSSHGLHPGTVTMMSVKIQLPKCEYHRDTNLNGELEIRIKGVDPQILITGPDTAIQLSHHPLASSELLWNYRGEIIEKAITDTLLEYSLFCPTDSALGFAFHLLVNYGRRFVNREKLTPLSKRYRVPADFNNGEPVNIHFRIQPDGEIIFKYW